MVTDGKTYEVTGDLTPDVTGTYENGGEYEGKRYYQRTVDPWYIWWNGISHWFISEVLGLTGVARWSRMDPDIEGEYEPLGDALGDATVTEI